MKGLKVLSKPYKVPATVARIATIIQVIATTRSGLMPDNRAKSSLSENALIDLPVRVRFKNQKRAATIIIAVTKVILCVTFIAKPSFKPVNSLNSRALIINRIPSANL